ncbi:mating-type protein MAT alpha 1 [Aureobasidium pullulans]|nr:mating-type protein MAT alpha 1 [Aureobasidium pullulans]
MSSSFLTVKDNPVHISKLFKADAEEKDEEIMSMLDSIHNDLGKLATSKEPELNSSNKDSLNLSRKILFSTLYRLQTDKLVRVGSLYQSDQDLANKVSDVLTKDETAPPHLKRLMKSALREKLVESTDDFTVSLNLVAKPGVRLLSGLVTLEREGDQLLQEFFQLNREPNLAEIDMLADACNTLKETVVFWFALKRDQTRRLFVMQGLATKGSRLGTKLRKREHDLREGPTMRPVLPPEFSDPDLNEGWEEAGENIAAFQEIKKPVLQVSWSGMWETKRQARGEAFGHAYKESQPSWLKSALDSESWTRYMEVDEMDLAGASEYLCRMKGNVSAAFMPGSMILLIEKNLPKEIAQVIDAVMKMRSIAAVASTTPATVAGIGYVSVSTSAIIERKKRATQSNAASKNAHAETSPRAAGSIAPTCTLHSWMAFRSKLSCCNEHIFCNRPSGAFLLRAYSNIRESNSKSDAPLDMFLAVTCPLIGVVPRNEYLRAMGRTIAELDDGHSYDKHAFGDIVAHYLRVSYVRQNDTDIARNDQGSTAALTMAAQPTSNSNQVQQNNLAAHTRGMSGAFDMDARSASNSSQTAGNTFSPGQFVVDSEQAQQDQQDDHDHFNVQDALNANNNGAVGASGAVRQTVHDLSSQQYPFMDEFDPFSTSALEFDPFSMNHDAAFASNSIGTYLAPGDSVFPETFDIDDLLSSDLFDMTKQGTSLSQGNKSLQSALSDPLSVVLESALSGHKTRASYTVHYGWSFVHIRQTEMWIRIHNNEEE